MKADQLSHTAAFVAIKFYGLTRIPSFRRMFDEQTITFYENLVQTLPGPLRYYHFWLKYRLIRKLYIWSEELLLPGDLLHILARKWYLQRMCDQLIAEGYKQVLVLGAGFDHLALRYANMGLSCIEFDAPYMAEQKHSFYRNYYPDSKHPTICSAFLPEHRLEDLLRDHADIDPVKKTIVLAEGFFDYLEGGTIRDILQQLQASFKTPPALLSTHFALDELPVVHQWVFKSSVRMVGERLKFRASMNSFRQLLADNGYRITHSLDSRALAEDLKTNIDTKLPLLKGFYIFRAE